MLSRRLPPHEPPRAREGNIAVLTRALNKLGAHAKQEGAVLAVEPLNRYDDHMLNTIGAAQSLLNECADSSREGRGIVLGTYHMSIEEGDPWGAILRAKDRWASLNPLNCVERRASTAATITTMHSTPARVQKIYLTLLLCNTLAASIIWGINTLFLLDAGLSNLEAFAANAFFTAGMVLFEVPTGVIADLRGRRLSYLLGTITLSVSTLLYLLMWHISAPFWGWAVASVFLGLGFTFFSGAVEAWLVDALKFTGFKGKLESVLAKGEIVEGSAMLIGSVAGGLIAQMTNLGIPYVVRAAILGITFMLALVVMRDLGFTPARGKKPLREVKHILRSSIKHGLGNPPVRWIMLSSPFFWGASFYAFYAMQPYLLELYGNETAYSIAGLAAAIVAGAQIVGGVLVPHLGRLFSRRTTLILSCIALGTAVLAVAGFVPNFWVAIAALVAWGVLFSASLPVRQAYLNAIIPSKQRATMLSFDSLLGSTGGVVSQPLLGRSADVWSYPLSYIFTAAFQACAIPFAWAARRHAVDQSDHIETENRTAKSSPGD